MNKSKRLVLYFDVNKTVIMKDTSKGLNSVTMTVIQHMITKYSYVIS